MTTEKARAARPMAALRHAREIYREVTERFLEEAARLGDAVSSVTETKEFAALAATHHKALSALIEFEARIEKQIADRIGRGRGEFDLRKARDEILGKLAGLAARERSA